VELRGQKEKKFQVGDLGLQNQMLGRGQGGQRLRKSQFLPVRMALRSQELYRSFHVIRAKE
jgi:hypothetical protein